MATTNNQTVNRLLEYAQGKPLEPKLHITGYHLGGGQFTLRYMGITLENVTREQAAKVCRMMGAEATEAYNAIDWNSLPVHTTQTN